METETKQATCADRIKAHYDSRMDDIKALWAAYCKGEEDVEDLGNIYEYGLSFDYVAPGTFNGQRRGYFRWQLSCGGPSDEIRFYVSGPGYELDKVRYHFMDWFDGAKMAPRGKAAEVLAEIWEWFVEGGSAEHEYEKACED